MINQLRPLRSSSIWTVRRPGAAKVTHVAVKIANYDQRGSGRDLRDGLVNDIYIG